MALAPWPLWRLIRTLPPTDAHVVICTIADWEWEAKNMQIRPAGLDGEVNKAGADVDLPEPVFGAQKGIT